jgi:hypothetical protein
MNFAFLELRLPTNIKRPTVSSTGAEQEISQAPQALPTSSHLPMDVKLHSPPQLPTPPIPLTLATATTVPASSMKIARAGPESSGARSEIPTYTSSTPPTAASVTTGLIKSQPVTDIKMPLPETQLSTKFVQAPENPTQSIASLHQSSQASSSWSSSIPMHSKLPVLPGNLHAAATSPSKLMNLEQTGSFPTSRMIHSSSANNQHRILQSSVVRDSTTLSRSKRVAAIAEQPSSYPYANISSTRPLPGSDTLYSYPPPTAPLSTIQSASSTGPSRPVPSTNVVASGSQTTIWSGQVYVESLPPHLPFPVSFNAIGIHLCRSEEEAPDLLFM